MVFLLKGARSGAKGVRARLLPDPNILFFYTLWKNGRVISRSWVGTADDFSTLRGFVDSGVEGKNLIQEADVEGLEEVTGGAGHPHLAAGGGDLVVAGNEAPDSGA